MELIARGCQEGQKRNAIKKWSDRLRSEKTRLMLNTTIWRQPSAQLVRTWKPMPEEGWIWICPFLARFLKHLLSPAARDSFLGDLLWPRWMFCRFVSEWSVVKWHLDHPQNRSDTERQGNNRGSLQSSHSHGLLAGSEGWQHICVCVISLMDLVTEFHKTLSLPVWFFFNWTF